MDRGLKQILWMSWTLRYRTICLNYVIPNRVSQSISQNYWTKSKDICWSEKLEPLKKIMRDSETYSTNDFLHVLNSFNDKHSSMSLKDTLDVLTALVTTIAKEDKSTINFMNHPGFEIICEQLRKQIRFMNLSEVIDSIKLLTFFNVPASTILMQNLLQIVRNSINDLELHQIHILICLLKKMENTSLSSALLIALPILLPNIINTKLNYADLNELSLALFHIKVEGEKQMIVKICKSIQAVIKENPKAASASILKNIFNSLCHVSADKYDSYVLLNTLKLVQKILLTKAFKLSITEIMECTRAVSYSVTNGNMTPFNTTFLNTLLEVAMSKDINFNNGCRIQKHLNNMLYVYVPFLEYLLNRTSDSSNINSNHNLKIFLNAFCISDYKIIPWTCIENNILELKFLNNCPVNYLLQYALYLIALDKFYPQVVSTTFVNLNVKNLILIENRYASCMKLLHLYQVVKTLYTEYEGPWPSEETLSYIYNMAYILKKSTLNSQLQIAMGGPQYVLANLRTKIGHIIDCAVIMRKGGYPIAFNTDNSEILANYKSYVEDLQCPPESYVILILAFPRTAYSMNTFRLLNIKRLYLKSLEKWTGHKCIDINLNILENLPNHEKNSYIMQKIRNICNDIIPNM